MQHVKQSLCPSIERLGRFLAGDLSTGEEGPVATHLGDCARCQDQVEQLLADDSVLTWRRTAADRTAARPPADFMDSMRRLVPLVATSSITLAQPEEALAADVSRHDPEPLPLQIGSYQIIDLLGRGGMSVVYKARQSGLARIVALKVLRFRETNSPDVVRFFREAATVARMHHPNIVQVHEVGENEGRPFLALEYIPGGNLAEHLRGIPADPRDAAQLLETVARAVHHAHEQGVVHRDLKPSNILLDVGAGSNSKRRPPLSVFIPKVSDFGLARVVTEDQSLTLPGVLVGTPAYLAPESIHQPGVSTPVGDVYALGVILYEALTGRPPLVGPTALATLRLVDAAVPVPPSRLQPHLPRDLDTICLACLHKHPGRRYPSALALAEDLRRFLDGRPIKARRVGRLETGWLWCRRNPVSASLGAALAGSVLIGLVAAMILLGQARQSANEASISAERAGKNETLALESAARADASARLANDRAYGSDLQFASLMWMNGQRSALVDLLEGQRLGTDGADRRGFEWYFLWSCAHPPHRSVPLRNQGRDLATPRDGRYFAVATGESEVELLDMAGKSFRTLAGAARIIRVGVSADGRRVAGASEDGTTQVWDADTGSLLRTLGGHRGSVYGMSFHPDGRTLATAGQDGTVRVWDTEDQGAEPLVLSHLDTRFSSAAFSPDGKRLAVGGSDRLVRIWDTSNWEEQPPLTGHVGEVLTVRFAPDSVHLASGSRDRTVRLWDAATGKLLRVMPAYQDAVASVAFSADGRSLASVSFDQSVRVVDVDSGLESRTLLGHDDVVTGVVFDPAGRTLVSTGWDRTVRLWDLNAARPYRLWRGHAKPIRAAAFAPKSGGLATGSLDGTVRVWDPATGAERQVLGGHIGGVLSLAFAPDDRLATASADKQVLIWDLATGHVTHTLGGHDEQINDVRFGASGRLLAGAGEGGSIYVWDANRDWANSRVLVKLPAAVTCVRFDPTGATLAAGCSDGTVRLLDFATGLQRHQLGGHVGGVTTMDFSPDGRQLAVGSVDRAIRVWDAQAGTLAHALRGHVRGVTAVCFGPDGRRLFSGSQDGTLQVWHTDRGQPLVILTDHYATTALAVAEDGSAVASAGPEGVIGVRWASVPPGR